MRDGQTHSAKFAGVLELDVVSALSVQISTLTNQVNQMNLSINKQQAQPVQQVQIFCEVCGEGHMSNLCPANSESVYFVGNANQGQTNQYGDTYNPNWRNHPNFSWGGNQGTQNQYRPQAPQQQYRPPQVEQQASHTSHLEDMLKKVMAEQQALATTVRNLEHQMGQLASAQNTRPAGALPSDTEPNPKAQVNAVTLINGRALEEVPKKKKNIDHPEGELAPKPVEGNEKDDKGPKLVIETRPPPPFPRRLQKQKDDAKYKTFLDILSQMSVNLPLVEILQEVPMYARYLRDIVANKQRHAEFETVGRALCDLGANINLMSSSLFKQLGLGALRPTTITLQLADMLLVMPEGIIEEVLVRVGKFILPADFIVLDYEADEEVPIILGRPFLATGGAIIDVRAGKLKMRVDDEEVTFNVYKALKLPKHYEDLCMITVVESKGIKQSPYVNYSDPDGTTELKEVVFPAERAKMIEKRTRDERGDLLRARKKARIHGRKKKRKRPT
uniref:Uncharacterized protein LOC104244988 n=1 Tax=Nicotiana sylvestris TaxID=4096 RepID=A0A1U7Y6S2_NICSY|nr:PREDICTED: uncharacterized protein LOC104244988 [Nicotiana sylvestris]